MVGGSKGQLRIVINDSLLEGLQFTMPCFTIVLHRLNKLTAQNHEEALNNIIHSIIIHKVNQR